MSKRQRCRSGCRAADSAGWGRLIIDDQGDRTIITTTALPPDVLPLVSVAKETALGLVFLLAVIVIVGPFARMFARRMERRPELEAATHHAALLQQQIEQLQQSGDAIVGGSGTHQRIAAVPE